MAQAILQFTRGVGASLTETIPVMDSAGLTTKVKLRYGGWAPKTPRRTRNQMKPYGNYDLVQEKLSLTIRGADVNDTYNEFNRLYQVFVNADDWLMGRSNVPTYINYLPPASSLVAFWYAPIYGLVSFEVNEEFNNVDQTLTIYVALVFLRHGEWFGGSLNTSSNVAATVGDQYTHTLTALATADATPYLRYRIATTGYFAAANWPNAILATTVDSNGITVFVPAAVTSGGSGSLTADTSAFTGQFRRYTTAGTIVVDPTAFTVDGSQYAVIVCLKNNSATTTWALRINIGSTSFDNVNLDPLVIDGTVLNPTLFVVGVASFGLGFNTNVNLTIQNLTGVSAALDINYVALVKLRKFSQPDPVGAIIRIKPLSGAVSNTEIVVDPGLLQSPQSNDRPAPVVARYDTGFGFALMDWEGNPFISLRGNTIYSRLFQTGISAANWRPMVAGVVNSVGMRIERRVQSLTPR